MSFQQNVLVVDDKKANVFTLKQILNELCSTINIVSCFSGQEALKACLNNDFALAILDVQMPEMDGYELAGILRGDDRTQYLPIIFLTALRIDDNDVYMGYRSGAIDYIVKPFKPEILLAKVQAFLQIDYQRRQLKLQHKQLQAMNEELQSFAYSVSHDLRAPLRAVKGFADILQDDYGSTLDEEGINLISVIRENSEIMGGLIDAILNLSRSSSGEIYSQLVDLSEIAESIFSRLHEQDPERDVKVVIMPEVKVEADYHMMTSVMENLCTNAWKYTAKCQQAEIEFTQLTENNHTIYCMKDNGAGFDMADADNLFKPFTRLHSEKEFEGIGIGLATVKRIIHRHGGEIWAKAGVNKGASFYFYLEQQNIQLENIHIVK